MSSRSIQIREKAVALFDYYPLSIGSIALFASVFGSRWLSQIPVGSVYLFDLLVLIGVASVLRTTSFWKNRKRLLLFAFPFLPLTIWALLRSPWSALSEEVFRDLHPFVMAIYGFVVCVGACTARARDLKMVRNLIQLCLLGHVIWVVVAKTFPYLSTSLGGALEIRGDLDGTLTGVLGLILVSGRFQALPIPQNVQVLLGFCSLCVVGWLGSRAAVVGVLVMTVLLLLMDYRWRDVQSVDRPRGHLRIWSTAGLVILATVGSAVALDSSGRLMNATNVVVSTVQGDLPDASPASGHGSPDPDQVREVSELAGTAWARLRAWELTLQFATDSTQVFWLGAGTGSSYLYESGAAEALLGKAGADAEVTRHPHNALLHVFAMLGLPAAVWLSTTIGAALIAGILTRGKRVPLTTEVVLLLSGLIVAAMFGVIFEGPYGSIPIFWSLGFLLSNLSTPGSKNFLKARN